MQRSGAFKSDLEVSEGRFLRQKSRFTDWVTADGSSGYRAEPGRYHLYVGRACPWSQRDDDRPPPQGPRGHDRDLVRQPLPRRARLGLRGRRLRRRPARLGLPLGGLPRQRPELRGAHQRARAVGPRDGPDRQQRLGRRHPHAQQRWDEWGDASVDLYPEPLRAEIDAINEWVYDDLNNGVYKAGFARSQEAYDEAFDGVFGALSRLEEILGERRYLTGDTLTEADWRAWVTLLRFDPVYHTHFRLNGRRVMDHPNLWGFTRELYQLPGIAETTAIDEIKTHYYTTHDELNPKHIIPRGPLDWDLTAPHGRG